MSSALVTRPEVDAETLRRWATAMNGWLAMVGLRSGRSRQTYEAAWRSFVRCVAKMPWEVTPDDVTRYVAQLQAEEKSPLTVNSYLSAISSFYAYCAAIYPPLTSYNPTRLVGRLAAPEEAPDAVSLKEYQVLMASIAGEDLEDLRDRALIATYMFTGMRNAAVREMRLRQLVREGEGVAIRYFSKKPDKKRFPPPAWEHVERYLAARRVLDGLKAAWVGEGELPEADWVFVAHAANAAWISEGKPLSASAQRKMLKARGRAALGREVRPHMFRHGAGRVLDEAGVEVREISNFLRHASLDQTLHYLERLKKMDADDSAAATMLRALGL